MKSEWTTRSISDIAEINPRESISKGSIAKKIPMDVLQPFTRDVPGYQMEKFKGGTKFRNMDTIMARITPCLENGKTAQVRCLDNGEVGFGSTEYIVFRAKEGTDPDYLYYLICSPLVRDPAIKSMVGSSGRQRVQTDVVANLQIAVPDFDEQKNIGGLLKALDDKIQLNTAINKNLLQQASSIYQAWFEDFVLSDGSCPSDWSQGTLSDIADITNGKRPPFKSSEKTDTAVIPLVGAASVMGYTTEANHTDKILVIGRVGTHGVVQRFNSPCWTSDNTLVITSDLYEYTFQILQRIDYHAMNRGSTQPLITQGDMNKVSILIPDKETLSNFENLVGQLMKQYEANLLENVKLAELRDTLLPRLMSGDLDVSLLDL
ncbi:restriction endonuclease subunit S [uncultured Mitsuokella sp.]|uniref:restriction endonuclease subunit S n=1 Tax=uncultured Mitsuokella sp. TaxID=453120 RepID=UPI00266FC1CB|nr:restriction endonuclease subunit S [uncultured Mitsuokella sp.]